MRLKVKLNVVLLVKAAGLQFQPKWLLILITIPLTLYSSLFSNKTHRICVVLSIGFLHLNAFDATSDGSYLNSRNIILKSSILINQFPSLLQSWTPTEFAGRLEARLSPAASGCHLGTDKSSSTAV